MTNDPQILLHSVSKAYRQGDITVCAVDNVSLQVSPASSLVITGRSGAGKTTLLSLMGGLTRPTIGSVCINGIDVATMNDAALSDLRAREIGFVFQFASLMPTLTALQNVQLAGVFAQATQDTRRARELLILVGLRDKVNSYPAQLSGGQQRRVAIARALMNRPAILLADEPTGDLDVDTEFEILELMRAINADGMTVILVTHNPNLTDFGSRHLIMERGKLIETSNPLPAIGGK